MRRHPAAASGLLILVLLSFTAPRTVAAQAAAPVAAPAPAPLDDASWSLFQKVFGMVLKDYVDPKTPQEVILGALKGAAASAGPECAYIPPDEVATYRASERAPGLLPLYVSKDSDFARILAVFPGQDPSIKAGDALRFIGNKSTYDMTYPQILEALRGPGGDKVRCIFLKKETWQNSPLTLTRRTPALAQWTPLGTGAGALAIPCLESSLPAETASAVRSAHGSVIVDLRGCASGDTRAALRWAGDLLGKAQGPSRKGPKETVQEPLTGPGWLAGRPLRVWVDGTTARGGEVLALALARAGATLIGAPSFGWAPYSQDIPLDNGGLIRLNTAYFLDAEGKALKSGHGLTPAIAFTPAEGLKPPQLYLEALKAVATQKPREADGHKGSGEDARDD